MKTILMLIFLLLTSIESKALEIAKVVRVIDGDTVKIQYGGKIETIRLIGVDTPELKQEYGKQAKEYLEEKILNKNVTLEIDKKNLDFYSRKLRYIFVSNENINELIIKEGYGLRSYVYPNNKYDKKFIEAEINARNKRVNIWSTGLKETPKEFRKNK